MPRRAKDTLADGRVRRGQAVSTASPAGIVLADISCRGMKGWEPSRLHRPKLALAGWPVRVHMRRPPRPHTFVPAFSSAELRWSGTAGRAGRPCQKPSRSSETPFDLIISTFPIPLPITSRTLHVTGHPATHKSWDRGRCNKVYVLTLCPCARPHQLASPLPRERGGIQQQSSHNLPIPIRGYIRCRNHDPDRRFYIQRPS